MVQENFENILNMITTPFLAITVPVAVLAAYLLIDKFKKQESATDHLADEIGKLAVSVAKLQGAAK